MQRFLGFNCLAMVVLVLVATPACVRTGGEPATAECKAAMKAYSDELVEHQTDASFDEGPAQLATLNACTEGGWLDAVEPYSDGSKPGAIAIDKPRKVLAAMCEGQDPRPKACE